MLSALKLFMLSFVSLSCSLRIIHGVFCSSFVAFGFFLTLSLSILVHCLSKIILLVPEEEQSREVIDFVKGFTCAIINMDHLENATMVLSIFIFSVDLPLIFPL